MSKQLERFLLNWIWPYVKPHMDPDQLGGLPGTSVEHYIIKMVDFILSAMDGDTDAAVLAMPVDYSKAFNRMLHSTIINDISSLSNPSVPTCAIRLLKSYLTQRSMSVRYKGEASSFRRVPGGGPQGGLLTGLLFCLQVRLAGSPCQPATRQLPALAAPGSPAPPAREEGEEEQQPCTKKSKLNKEAYIDDLTMLEKISLSDLVVKERQIGPHSYHDRFNLTLPPHKSVLQHQIEDLVRFTKAKSMIINQKKTKCLPFINSRTKDFMPELKMDGKTLDVIYQLKLVGLVITADLSWAEHVDYTVKRVKSTMWQLLRLKQMNAPKEKLIEFYILKIRSILMFGAVCFHSSLTAEQSQLLERQQLSCLATILGSEYTTPSRALQLTNLPTLATLREEACFKWAVKAQASSQHSHLFPVRPSHNTRSGTVFKEPQCRGSRYYRSAVPAMARLLNARGVAPASTGTITTNSGAVIQL